MPNVRLSQSRIEALRPRRSPYDVRDAELKGFGVRVLPSGSKRFFIHSQHEGQPYLEDRRRRRRYRPGGGPPAGRAALVRLPSRDARRGRPVRADPLRHHAPDRTLRLPPGRQQSLHRHSPLNAIERNT